MDFSAIDGGQEKFLNVLRNHHYTFDITSVSAKGYDDTEDAFCGTSRLTAKISEWDLAQQNALDGQHYLKVSRDQFAFTAAGGQLDFTAETNYTLSAEGFPAGIQLDASQIKYNPAVAPGAGWITPVDVSGSNGNASRTISIRANPNPNPAIRSAKIHLHAGNPGARVRRFCTGGYRLQQ